MACRDRRQIEAVGLEDPAGLLVPAAIALAVGAVLHCDQAELDQLVIDLLGLRGPETERFLLHLGRGPHDRPGTFFPVLRLGEAEQPVDRVHQPRRNPEPRRRGLEGGQQLPGQLDALRQPGKTLCRAVGLEQRRRQPPKAGRSMGMGKAPPLRPVGAIVLCHRDLPLWLIATGKPSPLTETAISV